MKRQLIYIVSAVLLTTGCSERNEGREQGGFGTLSIVCSSSDEVSVRAATTPSGNEFSFTLTGDEYAGSWETISAFAAENPLLPQGDYTATVSWGDPTAEGYDKPYYTGSKQFELLPRRNNTLRITAMLGNAQVLVRTTEQFRAYFHDVQFTVTTGAANAFDFTFSSTATPTVPDSSEAVYVRAATTLSVIGTAYKQSATGDDKGPKVTFAKQQLDATKPHTRHIFEFDAANAGSATLRIYIGTDVEGNDLLVETISLDVELNDGAIV